MMRTMRSPVRAVAMIAAITGLAAVLMDAQAEAMERPAGALDVAVEARAQSRGVSVVSVRVTDAGGRELRSYETSVERMQ